MISLTAFSFVDTFVECHVEPGAQKSLNPVKSKKCNSGTESALTLCQMTLIQHLESYDGVPAWPNGISSFLNRSVIDEKNRKRLPVLWSRL